MQVWLPETADSGIVLLRTRVRLTPYSDPGHSPPTARVCIIVVVI